MDRATPQRQRREVKHRARSPSARTLRALVEAMNEGAATLSEAGSILYCNPRFAEIAMRPRRRLHGVSLSSLVVTEDRPTLEALLQRGGPKQTEVALRVHGGTRIPTLMAVHPLNAGGRRLLGLIMTDLSEQKHSEEMLAAEQLTRSMLEQAAEAIVVCDEEGLVVRASRAARRLCSQDPLLRTFRAAFPVRLRGARGRGGVAALVAMALRGRVHRGLEGRLRREDGEVFDLQLSAGPLRGPRGTIVGCVVTLTDVSAHRAAEADREELLRRVRALAGRLANQEKWLQAVLDSMPTPLVLAAPRTGRVLFANEAADRVTEGFFKVSMPASGKRWSATDGDGRSVCARDLPLPRATRGEKLEGDAVQWHNPSGKRCTLMSFSEKLPAMYGHPETVVVSFLDVSKLKQTEEQLQEAVRSRDDFLSIASHELKTPLTTMSLQVDGMLRGSEAHPDKRLPEWMAPRIRTLRRQCERLAHLIDDLLDVSRIRAGRLELVLEEVDIGNLAREVVERFVHEAAAAACVVTVDAASGIVGRWDRSRLDQVITNLVSNAIKYGAGKPIRVAVEGTRRSAKVAVRDHGIGVAPEHQTRIFQRFERAVTAERFRGMGLGLWISRQIVERLGGTIQLESTPGKGACFIVELPLEARPRRAASARTLEAVPAT